MKTKLKAKHIHLPLLHHRCTLMQHEIVALSGLTEDALADAHYGLFSYLSVWESHNKGVDQRDSYLKFCQFLHDSQNMWSRDGVSRLNGLTAAQQHLAWAYSKIKIALRTLTAPLKNLCADFGEINCDVAACYSIDAAKALINAKYLLASKENRLAQTAC
jgi:hypothetical protein